MTRAGRFAGQAAVPLPPEPVVGKPLDPQLLDATLQKLLDSAPSALLFALDAAAGRVPLPTHERFARCGALPGDNVTGVDYVIAADRNDVVQCWQRARTLGLGQATVRLACDPEQTVTLTIVDCRLRHGVWLGLIVPGDGWSADRGPLDPELVVPARPRTAEMQKNLYGIITAVDERTTRMLGWSAEEMLGRRSVDFIHPEDQERAVGQWLEMRASRQTQRIRLRHRHRDGHWIWVEVENTYLGLEDPEVVVALAYLTDISEEMAAIEAVRQQEKLFRRLTEALPVGVFQLDRDHRVVYANARVAALLGVPDAQTLAEQIATVDPAQRAELADAVAQALAAGADRQVEVDVLLPDDAERRRYLFTLAALSGQEGAAGAIVSVTDVTEGARLREELRIRATYDALTGCLNRAVILAELDRAITGPGVGRLAVIFVDLDRFKSVNDTHGHALGDELLVMVAHRLAAQARHTDLIGRIGGDEFLLLCPDVADTAQALAIAQRVHRILDCTILIGGKSLRMAASVGVTLAHPGTTADQLVAESDQAMYRAKRTASGAALYVA